MEPSRRYNEQISALHTGFRFTDDAAAREAASEGVAQNTARMVPTPAKSCAITHLTSCNSSKAQASLCA